MDGGGPNPAGKRADLQGHARNEFCLRKTNVARPCVGRRSKATRSSLG